MAGIIDLLIPKEQKFFEYLQKHLTLLDESVDILLALMKQKKISSGSLQKTLLRFDGFSDDSDTMSARIIQLLHESFVTPIDREEIYSLSSHIHRSITSVKKIMNAMLCFHITTPDNHVIKQVRLLKKAITILERLLHHPLSEKEGMREIEEVKQLEKEGDKVFITAMTRLFEDKITPIELIKQKNLCEAAEDALDDAKHIADIMQSILINHS